MHATLFLRRLLATSAALALVCTSANAHFHISAGIVDSNGNGHPNQGEPLAFSAGYIPGKIYEFMPRPVGQRYGGYYTLDEQVRVLNPDDYFTFLVLSDGQTVGDGDLHPLTGTDVWLEFVSVTGPNGGKLGFWEGQNESVPFFEQNRSFNSTTPTHSLTANQPTNGYKIQLSEPLPDFEPFEQDPYGHIHNRGFTVDKAGEYLVTVILRDLSGLGPGGTPLHANSQEYTFRIIAGPVFQPAGNLIAGTGYTMIWKSEMGISGSQTGIPFTIQRATTLSPPNWQNIGTVTGTTGATATFTDTNAASFPNALYRLSYPWFGQ